MSQQERSSYIEAIYNAIKSYQGFTSSEKEYGLHNIQECIDCDGNLDTLIKKFAQISLDIQPFLVEKQLIRA
jgi:hypothetical protein